LLHWGSWSDIEKHGTRKLTVVGGEDQKPVKGMPGIKVKKLTKKGVRDVW